MASAMSVTENSSKQSTQASSAEDAATGPIGIVALDDAGLQLRAPGVNALVHIGHEGMKMNPTLASYRERLEKQVHQHGLAAADRAPDVEPARRCGIAPAEQPAQRARLAGEPVAAQALRQGFELAQKRDLCRVAFERTAAHESVVRAVMDFGEANFGSVTDDRLPSCASKGNFRYRARVRGAPDLARTPFSAPEDPRRRAATAPPCW